MSRLGINTGTAPNDGTGDSLLDAVVKINNNFSEIYTTFGDGTSLVSYTTTAGISTSVIGGIASVTQLYVNTGISTLGTVKISSGIITATTGVVTYYGDGSKLTNIVTGVGINTIGGSVGSGVTILDFRGLGISTITVSSGIATINTASPPDPVMMSLIF